MGVRGASIETIDDFLAQKRIAMIGISRDPKSFSADLFRELSRHGIEVVPVNPQATEILGLKCFAHVQEVQPPVTGALLMTSSTDTDAAVADCIAAGIPRVWMYRAGGKGAVSDAAIALCHANGIKVVPGECPLMFLKGGHAIHRFHGFVRKITGSYPKHAQAS
jgi:predicted CoA-binding protein